MTEQQKRPFDVLNMSLNNTVIIGLKEGIEFRAVMAAYDINRRQGNLASYYPGKCFF